MSIVAGPKIIEDGLILYLDASNQKSYPGTGNTWFDLSGNGNHAILNGNSNNPVWNSSGYFYFPATTTGVNGGMVINNSSTLQYIYKTTVELFFTLETKTLGDSDWMSIFSRGIDVNNQIPGIAINQNNSQFRYLQIKKPESFNSSVDLFTDYTGNTWYHVVLVLSEPSFGYLNTLQVSTSPTSTSINMSLEDDTETSINIVDSSFPLTLGLESNTSINVIKDSFPLFFGLDSGGEAGAPSNSFPIYLGLNSVSEMFKGKLTMVKVYNRALSPSEIKTNFEAFRSRYRI